MHFRTQAWERGTAKSNEKSERRGWERRTPISLQCWLAESARHGIGGSPELSSTPFFPLSFLFLEEHIAFYSFFLDYEQQCQEKCVA
jgi:hypothetical protein